MTEEAPQIQVGPNFIRIMLHGDEVVRWYYGEWKEDPYLVFKIVEAVTVAAFAPEMLISTLKTMGYYKK